MLEDSEEKLRRPSENAIVCPDTRHSLCLIAVYPDIANSTEETVSMLLKGATWQGGSQGEFISQIRQRYLAGIVHGLGELENFPRDKQNA